MLKPINDCLVVEFSKSNEKTEGGILLPATVKDENKFKTGTVVAVGPGRYGQDGKRVPMTVKEGQKVLMNWGGTDIEYKKVKYRVIREDDVLCIID